jgi:SOS response regulatory protein OraA/RecX
LSRRRSPPRVSFLRARPRGRIEVELEGEQWRTLPAEVVLAAGLEVGTELDRERARRLARGLREHEALRRAARAIAHRDLSERELEERLARRNVPAPVRKETVERLARAGAVDDGRLARGRADLLARRGAGDFLIRHDLEGRGIASELVGEALAGLEAEDARAQRIVAERGRGPRTARYLARKGFSEEAIESACEEIVAEDAPPAVR